MLHGVVQLLDRLDFVKRKLPGVETLNFKEKETVSGLRWVYHTCLKVCSFASAV